MLWVRNNSGISWYESTDESSTTGPKICRTATTEKQAASSPTREDIAQTTGQENQFPRTSVDRFDTESTTVTEKLTNVDQETSSQGNSEIT